MKAIFELNKVKPVVTAPKYKHALIEQSKKELGGIPVYSFEAEIYCEFCLNVDEYRQYLLDNYDRLERFNESLADDKSRAVLESVLKGRLTGNQDYFIDVREPDQYFPADIIKLNEHETIIELGAYDGKTLLDMLNRLDRKYDEIYCFEPDRKAFGLLKKSVENERGNIHLIEKATGAARGQLSLMSIADYGASQLSATAADTYKVDVVRVDDEINSAVTYIKMDIEGAELDSLKGMERIIKENRPTMAICVYHNNSDILDIPEYVRKLVPEYKMYLRHHNWGAAETVLYCTLDTN